MVQTQSSLCGSDPTLPYHIQPLFTKQRESSISFLDARHIFQHHAAWNPEEFRSRWVVVAVEEEAEAEGLSSCRQNGWDEKQGLKWPKPDELVKKKLTPKLFSSYINLSSPLSFALLFCVCYVLDTYD